MATTPGARSEFILHRGTRILRLDHSGLDERQQIAQLAHDLELIAQCAPRSVLLLTIPASRVTSASAEAIKAYLTASAPRIRASAVVRPHGAFTAAFVEMNGAYVQSHLQYERTIVDDEAAALEWLWRR